MPDAGLKGSAWPEEAPGEELAEYRKEWGNVC